MNENEKETIHMASQDESAETNHVEQQKQDIALQACKQEVAQLTDSYKRLAADFENAKRRMEKDRQQWTRVAQAEVLVGLLKIVDDLKRALNEKGREKLSPELEPWFQGFSLINKEFEKYLTQVGITEVPTREFDPELHEAVMSVESEKSSGSIVDVFENGYMFKDQVLRPAKVSVAK